MHQAQLVLRARGVETAEEMAVLAPLKPDLVQGYLYGRPMSAEDARQLLQKQNSDMVAICQHIPKMGATDSEVKQRCQFAPETGK